jgi:membrane protein
MKAMNRAYDVEESRSFWKKYLIAIGLTLLAGTFVIGAFMLLVGGQFLASRGAEALGLRGVWETVLNLIRWPVALALVMVAMAFLYWAAPNIDLPFKWITPGAVVFTIVWVVATLLFGWYVSAIGNYNATYGALGGVVVLLLWFYITSFIMLLGAELNAVVGEQVEPETVQGQRAEKQAESNTDGEQGRPR